MSLAPTVAALTRLNELQRAAAQLPRTPKDRIFRANPVLALPAIARMQAMSPEFRAEMRALLKELALDARERADKCWRTHKAPMAAYWKAVSVYAGHVARALR